MIVDKLKERINALKPLSAEAFNQLISCGEQVSCRKDRFYWRKVMYAIIYILLNPGICVYVLTGMVKK